MPGTLHEPVFALVDLYEVPRVVLLRAVADLDLATIPDADQQLKSLLDAHPTPHVVVVDFDIDVFVGVGGVRLLLDTGDDLRDRSAHLLLSNPPAGLRRILEVLPVDTEIGVFDSVRHALRASRNC